MAAGLAGSTIFALHPSTHRTFRRAIALTWGLVYLLTAMQGFHPTKGYWCATGALVLMATGMCVARILSWVTHRSRPGGVLAAVAIIALFLPQAGLRTWWKQLLPTTDARYNAPEFARRMIAQLPKEGRFLVDPGYVMDVWLSGRDVTVRTDGRDYLVPRQSYDWLVESRDGLDKNIPKALDGELVQSFGHKDDPLACYAELHRPRDAGVDPPKPLAP